MSGDDLGNDLQTAALLLFAGLALAGYSVGMSLSAIGGGFVGAALYLYYRAYREVKADEESPQEVVDA